MYPIYEVKTNRNGCGYNHWLSPTKHLHRQVEMVVVLEGEATACIDDVAYPMQAGDVFMALPNQVHSYYSDERYGYGALIIVESDFCPDFRDILLSCVLESPIAHRALTPLLRRLCEQICTDNEKREYTMYYHARLRAFVTLLYARFFEFSPPRQREHIDTDALQNILSYCSQNYAQDLSLDTLAQTLHISKFHISHLLNGKLHMTFSNYLNSIRIAAAIPLLEEGKMTVTELSHRVGYNSTRTFNRAFLRQMGMTPRAYRTALEQGEISKTNE